MGGASRDSATVAGQTGKRAWLQRLQDGRRDAHVMRGNDLLVVRVLCACVCTGGGMWGVGTVPYALRMGNALP